VAIPGYIHLGDDVGKLEIRFHLLDHLHQLDEALYSRLLLLLSDQSPICDNLMQEAALKATIVLVHK
jgi:hypothetical protein